MAREKRMREPRGDMNEDVNHRDGMGINRAAPDGNEKFRGNVRSYG